MITLSAMLFAVLWVKSRGERLPVHELKHWRDAARTDDIDENKLGMTATHEVRWLRESATPPLDHQHQTSHMSNACPGRALHGNAPASD